MLNTIDELIEALGGNDAAAKIANVTRPAVSNWKARGLIPAVYWQRFDEELRRLRLKANPAIFFK